MDTLALLAGPVGSGIAGSLLFTLLRRLFPAPATAPGQPLYTWYWLVWSPQGARSMAMALSALTMVAATGLLAASTGGDVGGAMLASLDSALAASGISQLFHLPQLSGAVRTAEA